jgi:hypothetical protein
MNPNLYRVVRADTPKKVRILSLRTSRNALRQMAPELFTSAPTTTKTFTQQELKAIATYVKIVLGKPNTNVVCGLNDFSAFVKYRKGTLTYIVFDLKPKQLRILIYESMKEETTTNNNKNDKKKTTAELINEIEINGKNDTTNTTKKKSSYSSTAAVLIEGKETLPESVAKVALDALNDITLENTETRAQEMRNKLSEKFGNHWHVIHDEYMFAVASDKTTFTIESINSSTNADDVVGVVKTIEKELFFVAQKGRTTFTVWHHNAPAGGGFGFFDWFWKMESSEKLKLLRYFCLFCATGLAVASRAFCGAKMRKEGTSATTLILFCRASTGFTPILIGIFVMVAFFTSIFASQQRKFENKLGQELLAASAANKQQQTKRGKIN